MNERIKLLAEQARIKDHWSIDECRYLTNYLDEQKFAELIVKECADIADKAEPYKANDLIKEHFGVEDRAVPILSADEQALFAGITSSKLFTIAGAKKHFGVEK